VIFITRHGDIPDERSGNEGRAFDFLTSLPGSGVLDAIQAAIEREGKGAGTPRSSPTAGALRHPDRSASGRP